MDERILAMRHMGAWTQPVGNPYAQIPGDRTPQVNPGGPRKVRVIAETFKYGGDSVELGQILVCNATDAANLVMQGRVVYA